jgi:hypothetical protein
VLARLFLKYFDMSNWFTDGWKSIGNALTDGAKTVGGIGTDVGGILKGIGSLPTTLVGDAASLIANRQNQKFATQQVAYMNGIDPNAFKANMFQSFMGTLGNVGGGLLGVQNGGANSQLGNMQSGAGGKSVFGNMNSTTLMLVVGGILVVVLMLRPSRR